jgi:hypothetical protein
VTNEVFAIPLVGIAVLVFGAILLIGGLVAVVLLATMPKREDRR